MYGVAVLLLAGVVVIAVASRARSAGWPGRIAVVLMAVIGAGLLLRGVAVEIALAANVGGLRTSVGPLESRWSLIVWNPWFALGGALFLATAKQSSPAHFGRTDPPARSASPLPPGPAGQHGGTGTKTVS